MYVSSFVSDNYPPLSNIRFARGPLQIIFLAFDKLAESISKSSNVA